MTILFKAHAGQIAGGVFGLQTVTTTQPGTLLGINMSLPAAPALGAAAESANVVDNFQNLSNHPITSSPWLTLTSDNTNVIAISANNTLAAVGIGTATVTASYLGYTVSQTITVTAAALRINLSGTKAVISWPSSEATLQSSSYIGPASGWSPVSESNSIISTGGTNSLTVPIGNNARYFRLAY